VLEVRSEKKEVRSPPAHPNSEFGTRNSELGKLLSTPPVKIEGNAASGLVDGHRFDLADESYVSLRQEFSEFRIPHSAFSIGWAGGCSHFTFRISHSKR
jgi:hypothetical protein